MVKKIIAREGLIILSIIVIFLAITKTSPLYTRYTYIENFDRSTQNMTQQELTEWNRYVENVNTQNDLAYKKRKKIYNVMVYFLIFSYPAYLLLRFVFWAIRTLKEK